MKFTMYRDKSAKWRWKLKATNGDIIGCSSQGHSNKLDCQINCEILFDGLRANKADWHTCDGVENL